MRKKNELLKDVTDSLSSDNPDELGGMLIRLGVELLVDIRDQLALLNNKIPVVRPAGTPTSAPPPEVR